MTKIREPYRSGGIMAPVFFALGAVFFGGLAAKDLIDRVHPMGWGHSDQDLRDALICCGGCFAGFLVSFAIVRFFLGTFERL
jgi:hypothetical protein